MGRQQDPDLSITRNPAKKARRFLCTARVEAGEWLIEEQEPRLGRQSVGDQDSLLFAAGQGPTLASARWEASTDRRSWSTRARLVPDIMGMPSRRPSIPSSTRSLARTGRSGSRTTFWGT